MQPELILDARAELGEGPAWDATRSQLYWVDILAGNLHIYHPEQNLDEKVEVGQTLGTVAPTRAGNLLLGLHTGIAALPLASVMHHSHLPVGDGLGVREKLTFLAQPELHIPGNRFNDGKCSPEGRFIAGTMDMAEKDPTGALYSLSPDGTFKTLKTGVRISNGLTWSPDAKTLYYIDTPTRAVTAFDYDSTNGEIANPREVISVPPALGWPDGMTSDSQGRLWIGMWGGGAVTVWDPATGKLIETLKIPAKNVTACAFGGPQLDTLYVTSARKGLSQADLTAYPQTGGLFRVQTRVTGSPTFVFQD
jgi:sugar lactone lactonase YvrE